MALDRPRISNYNKVHLMDTTQNLYFIIYILQYLQMLVYKCHCLCCTNKVKNCMLQQLIMQVVAV